MYSARKGLVALSLMLAFFVKPALAQVNVDSTRGLYDLTGQMALLQDSDRQWSLTDLPEASSDLWQRLENTAPNFSFNKAVWWLRLPVVNHSDQPVDLVFDIAQPLLDDVNASWLVGGEVAQQWQTGNRHPTDTRPIQYRGFAFPLTLPPGASGELILRVDTFDGLYDALPLSLSSNAHFYQGKLRENLGFGLYYGIISALLLYNLIVWWRIRERNFLLYSLYLGSFLMWNLAFRGYLAMGPLANSPLLNNQAVGFFASGIFVFLSLFTIHFLSLKKKMPRMRWLLLGVSASILVPVIQTLAGYYAVVYQILIPQALIVITLVLISACYLSFKGQRSARIFLVAWGFLIVSAFAYYARVYDLIPSTWLTENALNIGSAIEVFVLAIALADRINQLKKQQSQDQAYILEQERDHNEQLQQRVAEQTESLRRLNRQLQHDSVTDSLTGLRNRRTFYHSLGEALKRASRQKEQLALALIDLDLFKQINDHWGHPYGDEVLKQVSEAMSKSWKRSTDGIFRLGGEEFGVIFQVKKHQDLPYLLETFREKLATREINYPQADQGYLTASIGMVVIEPGEQTTQEAVYSRADLALYASKARGRDCITYARPEHGPEADLEMLFE